MPCLNHFIQIQYLSNIYLSDDPGESDDTGVIRWQPNIASDDIVSQRYLFQIT